ncbi:hypothetical protein Hanom_Chr09g00823851 [Helianthus anomalus]
MKTTNEIYMSLTTKCIGHDIRLTRVVANLAIVVVERFHPTSLSHIEFFLVKDVCRLLWSVKTTHLVPYR